MEWSFDVESKFFVEFTLGWLTLPFVNEDDIPLLMDLSILYLVSRDMSSLGISSSLDTQELILVINSIDVSSISLPHLPPS
jgi:hypothetical protein